MMPNEPEIITLSRGAFFDAYRKNGGKVWYYPLIRAFMFDGNIYMRKDAFFLFPSSRDKLIRHEHGHIKGKKHTKGFFDVMCWHGFGRL